MSYQSIFPPRHTQLSEGDASMLDSQPFDVFLWNPYQRMNEISGITNSRYHSMNDIIGGHVDNTFTRLQ